MPNHWTIVASGSIEITRLVITSGAFSHVKNREMSVLLLGRNTELRYPLLKVIGKQRYAEQV